MKKIGIMTDSHSGILSEEAQRLGIKVLPMPFYIGEKVYREGVDLSRDEFYDMLRKGVDVLHLSRHQQKLWICGKRC